ncbi:MAG: glycosyltransferase [Candidatus Riflebacteria bacterium]|nr:glycosyltransferase [Candidatus Riflebacteria bacterium]
MSSPSAGIPPSPDDPPHGRYRRLSIIIPVYNEASAVGEVLDAIAATTLPLESEIVVVDDGSTDGTGEALDAWQRKMAAAPGPARARR